MANNSWPTILVGDLTINHDSIRVPVKEADRKPGPYPYYGASGVVDHVDGYLFEGDHLLIAEDGENLRTRQTPIAFMAKGRFWVNNHAHIVKGNDRALTRFLCYALANTDISGYLSGSTMPKLTQGNLNRIPILTPPLQVQGRIVEILGALDDKIELNRQMNETLESMARALFQSWFVDFDPVRAKAAVRREHPHWSNPEVSRTALPNLTHEIAELFPDSFEDSELGEIPTGWKVGSLSDVAEVVMGTSPAGDTYNESAIGTPLVNGPVEFGDYFPVKTKWTTEPTRFTESGDLIFCVRGSTTGRRVISDDRYCLGRGVCAIRAKRGWQQFINQTVEVELPRMLSRTTGSVFPSLGGPEMKNFQIVVAEARTIDEFCRCVGPLQGKIADNVRRSLRLASIRDSLLPKLLSGELSTL